MGVTQRQTHLSGRQPAAIDGSHLEAASTLDDYGTVSLADQVSRPTEGMGEAPSQASHGVSPADEAAVPPEFLEYEPGTMLVEPVEPVWVEEPVYEGETLLPPDLTAPGMETLAVEQQVLEQQAAERLAFEEQERLANPLTFDQEQEIARLAQEEAERRAALAPPTDETVAALDAVAVDAAIHNDPEAWLENTKAEIEAKLELQGVPPADAIAATEATATVLEQQAHEVAAIEGSGVEGMPAVGMTTRRRQNPNFGNGQATMHNPRARRFHGEVNVKLGWMDHEYMLHAQLYGIVYLGPIFLFVWRVLDWFLTALARFPLCFAAFPMVLSVCMNRGYAWTNPRLVEYYENNVLLPKWAPPTRVMEYAWPICFIAMGYAAKLVAAKQPLRSQNRSEHNCIASALMLWTIQYCLCLLWPTCFSLYDQRVSFHFCCVLTMLVGITAHKFGRISRSAGMLMKGYFIWMAYVCVLSYYITCLNAKNYHGDMVVAGV